jgi:hypothetical protein
MCTSLSPESGPPPHCVLVAHPPLHIQILLLLLTPPPHLTVLIAHLHPYTITTESTSRNVVPAFDAGP